MESSRRPCVLETLTCKRKANMHTETVLAGLWQLPAPSPSPPIPLHLPAPGGGSRAVIDRFWSSEGPIARCLRRPVMGAHSDGVRAKPAVPHPCPASAQGPPNLSLSRHPGPASVPC